MEEVELSEAEVRALVRLVGEVAVLEGDLSKKKQHLMNGLCRLVGVDCWIWMLIPPTRPGEHLAIAGMLHGGFDEQRLVAYLKANEHPEMARFNGPFIQAVRKQGGITTRLRQQLDPENAFLQSDVYPLWEAANIAPILLTCHPFPDGSMSAIGLYRDADKPLFNEREARLVHILLKDVPWLHDLHRSPQSLRENKLLAPRVRTTLNLLLEGLGRKQIAAHLGITENTVSGYVKQVYRHYGVQSHAELMRHFRHGDGGDR